MHTQNPLDMLTYEISSERKKDRTIDRKEKENQEITVTKKIDLI